MAQRQACFYQQHPLPAFAPKNGFCAHRLRPAVACCPPILPHQLRQLGDIHRDPPRLIVGEQLDSRAVR
jgi:hypothetical protein